MSGRRSGNLPPPNSLTPKILVALILLLGCCPVYVMYRQLTRQPLLPEVMRGRDGSHPLTRIGTSFVRSHGSSSGGGGGGGRRRGRRRGRDVGRKGGGGRGRRRGDYDDMFDDDGVYDGGYVEEVGEDAAAEEEGYRNDGTVMDVQAGDVYVGEGEREGEGEATRRRRRGGGRRRGRWRDRREPAEAEETSEAEEFEEEGYEEQQQSPEDSPPPKTPPLHAPVQEAPPPGKATRSAGRESRTTEAAAAAVSSAANAVNPAIAAAAGRVQVPREFLNSALSTLMNEFEARWTGKEAPTRHMDVRPYIMNARHALDLSMRLLEDDLVVRHKPILEDAKMLIVEALQLESVMRGYADQCEDLEHLISDVDHVMTEHPEAPVGRARATMHLMLGYCYEGRRNEARARDEFRSAREADPEVAFETYLDSTYNPYVYNTHTLAHDDSYFFPLIEIALFRAILPHVYAVSEPLRKYGAEDHYELPASVADADVKYDATPETFAIGFGLDNEVLARASAFFNEHDFVLLRNVLHPVERRIIAHFYETAVREKNAAVKFDPYLERSSMYNDRFGVFLNQLWRPIIQRITNPKPIKQAYSFLCHYENLDGKHAAMLRPHTDREDNEFTFSIQIYGDQVDAETGETRGNVDWPIFVHTKKTLPPRSTWRPMCPEQETARCGFADGDALLFKGREHIHYRENMNDETERLASLLLHFVDDAFDLTDYKLVRQKQDPSL